MPRQLLVSCFNIMPNLSLFRPCPPSPFLSSSEQRSLPAHAQIYKTTKKLIAKGLKSQKN